MRWTMLSRDLLVPVVALLPLSCGTQYAGISKTSAVEAAKAYVVRMDYRGDEPGFYRNTGNRPTVVRRTRDTSGNRSWFVRFDDLQAMHNHCVTVRRSSARVITKGAAC
jgi:hypothetical protein